MTSDSSFKLTYATMFNPPEALHEHFEHALAGVRGMLGLDHGMIIDGEDAFTADQIVDCSPANTEIVLGKFQKGTMAEAQQALAAARRAFAGWSRTPWQERVALVRKAAEIMDRRTYEIAAVVCLEVGKNRMEALGDVAETADLFRYACDRMETSNGYEAEMGSETFKDHTVTNTSVLRPYGVWLVISPFNFPCALTGGPAAAALVAGNTVVMKPATDTPWTARLIAECLREAGIPKGVCNYVTGPGGSFGQVLIESPEVDGVTFTGSYEVGMRLHRDFAKGRWVRPTILELGGKNAAIVSRRADLDDAAVGIVRSAFGLQGQKCSACSRVLVEKTVYDALVDKLVTLTERLVIGDPADRKVNIGPVINKNAYRDYQNFVDELGKAGKILTGGKVLVEGELAKGYFCTPTLAETPLDHPLWQQEMFLPITTLAPVKNLEQAMQVANHVNYGLTAGFYGSEKETHWFFENIEAGVTYANRPMGATTGAWPGYQPFGGWKASGSTGKNAGGLYYLPLYLREQVRTLVRRK